MFTTIAAFGAGTPASCMFTTTATTVTIVTHETKKSTIRSKTFEKDSSVETSELWTAWSRITGRSPSTETVDTTTLSIRETSATC